MAPPVPAGERSAAPLAIRVLAPALRGPAAIPAGVATVVRVGRRVLDFGVAATHAVGHVESGTRGVDDANRRRIAAAELRRLLSRLVAVHGLDVRVRGETPVGPAVLVANHVGYLDPIVLGSLVPCAPLAKRELAGWPGVGAGARALGVHFVRRGCGRSGARAIREGLRSLAAGVPVLGFPEGTTTTGESEALPFRRGLFGLARLAGVPVVPIAISYGTRDAAWIGDDPFVPHYLRTAARRRTLVDVEIGRPLHPEASPSAHLLAASARRYIDAMRRGQ